MWGRICCGQSAPRKRWIISGLFFLTISVSHSTGFHQDYPTCGSRNTNNNRIDFREPRDPGPFYDLTPHELRQLRDFAEKDPNILAVDPTVANISSSFLFAADLHLAKKSKVLDYLRNGGRKPDRSARLVMIRGDKDPPVVEEYVCGPLPNIRSCELLKLSSRRNPVEFTFRPLSTMEFDAVLKYVLPKVDEKVGFILQESYGSTFTLCKPQDCLTFQPSQIGSNIIKDITKRLMWFLAQFKLPFQTQHSLDFAVLVDCAGTDPNNWPIVKLWYANRVFQDFDELIEEYRSGRINKSRVSKPVNDENLYSSSKRRGEPLPPKPQRPPTLVEPDGKRYSLKNRQVEYMGWKFNFRTSTLTGPAIYDVSFKGFNFAYEISLSEFTSFYDGYSPQQQTSNFEDTGSESAGPASKSLIPGADCPDTATFIPNVFMSLTQREPEIESAGWCIFENNNGYPLRRHLSLFDFKYYGGMLDSVLILRSIITMWNYNFILDFIFYQNGAMRVFFANTGYMQTVFYTESELPYGFHIQKSILGHMHTHYVIIKADLDVGGINNSYTTLDIHQEKVNLTAFPDIQHTQVRFTPNLKKTEQEALMRYDFDKPKYHVIHNEAQKTNFGQLKGYRIIVNGMTKSLLEENEGNEPTVSWQRYQMITTRHHDDEISASSIYAMYDSKNPVTKFASYYSNDENIDNEDLVIWTVSGMHHIPRTEDLPVTTTVGQDLGFYLLPFNYFPDCPSMASRDAIYIEPKDPDNVALGLKVERYGNSRDRCVIPKPTLEEDVKADPGRVF